VKKHWLSIAVLAWIAFAPGCQVHPLSPAAPDVSTPSSGSGSTSFGAAPPLASSQFTVDPGAFSFPSTVIGTASPINAVATLRGTGIAIQLVAITSSNPSEFPVTTTCTVPGALLQGTACLVSIQFRPNAAGARSAQITMSTANAGSVSLALSGTGVQATLSPIAITPGSFFFPNTVVGSTSFTSALFTLTNTGTTVIHLTVITSSNPNEFPLTTTCNLPMTLVAGGSCTMSVQFRPSVVGNRSAQMTIATSDAAAGTTFFISGAGI
jgi:hypothetical protein